jgi:LPPG:FO 2-phospho-L-lactate transferase
MIVALAGGIGGVKLLLGLSRVVPPAELTIIGNTGDDIELHGLRVCPDLDTIIYTLAGAVDDHRGWGLAGESFNCLEALRRYGVDTWFQLGDRDLATHLFRTRLLKQGKNLSEVTRLLCRAWSVESRLLPMTEEFTPTLLETSAGRLHLQEYMVRERCEPQVRKLVYQGIDASRPAQGVEEAIFQAEGILICPSNPFISIGPILAVPGMKELIRRSTAPVLAVSPIIQGKAVKGPTAKMMSEMGMDVSAEGVALMYQGVADVFVLDVRDSHLRGNVEALGMEVLVTDTLMNTLEAKITLAGVLMRALG